MIELETIDVNDLDVVSNVPDLRRDLHVFAAYIQEHEVKRQHRSNCLSKPDTRRLAKMMSSPTALKEAEERGRSEWVGAIDRLALDLGIVSYDTEGSYASYSSRERSYPDNYIELNAEKYERFIESPPAKQERLMLNCFLDEKDGCESEFYRVGVLGRLDRFVSTGCGVGVVPMLDFPQIRRFLLAILQRCKIGVWYSVASLTEHLKAAEPFFLIPRKHKTKWREKAPRYWNFHESKRRWGSEIDISEKDPDAFERVEGRYVERFIEGAPLTMGYVSVAYSKQTQTDVYPSINTLKAFRVNNRLQLAMSGDIPPPKVTLLPTFDVYVESHFYPVKVLSQLTPLADVVSEDVTTVLKLKKEKVAARLTEDEKLDVVSLLTELTGRKLPQNVERELAGWAEHSEKFVLYKGFGLLESDQRLPQAKRFTVENISSHVEIVHSPDKLAAQLEKAELIPLLIKHSPASLRRLPSTARTVLPKETPKGQRKRKTKPQITLKRQTNITIHIPNEKVTEKLRKVLLDARCPVETDRGKHTITFSKEYEAAAAKAIKKLEEDYSVKIEDIA